MKEASVTERIGKDFNDEIEEIKKARIDNGLDKKKKSTKRLTNLFPKHKLWNQIKKDTIELNLEGKDE